MATIPDLTAASTFNIKDWVALVTGGGTGIGLMIARGLASNGAKVRPQYLSLKGFLMP